MVNCDSLDMGIGKGGEASQWYPSMASNQNSFPPPLFRSVLWTGAVVAGMVNQLLWLFGTDPGKCNRELSLCLPKPEKLLHTVPYGPWQQTDMAAQWAAELEELMPSLFADFGVRDAVKATVASAAPEIEGLATAAELRVRSWQENPNCCHVVLVNSNTSLPARPTIVLSGATAGLQGGSARRLFDAVYSVPTQAAGTAMMFTDWVAAGHTNVFRLGTNCSDTAVWRERVRAGS